MTKYTVKIERHFVEHTADRSWDRTETVYEQTVNANTHELCDQLVRSVVGVVNAGTWFDYEADRESTDRESKDVS